MFENFWNRIVEWFQDRSDRNNIIRSFNQSARMAFIEGTAPTLLKACISKGDNSYHHQFSHWLNSGFRITVLSGENLTKNQIIQVGEVILANSTLMRKLVVLGFDTLEILSDGSYYGCKWQIKDYLLLGTSNDD